MVLTGGWTRLGGRGVIEIAGPDAKSFLQGLLTADIDQLSPASALYGALLTPQGKILFDFFLAEADGTVLIDCEAARADALAKRLLMYRLRARAEFRDAHDKYAVWAFTGAGDAGERLAAIGGPGGVMFADPRNSQLGHRAILPAANVPDETAGNEADYHEHRIALGVPEGMAEMGEGTTFALEAGLDHLNGLSLTKGCFVGQELAARMHHRNAVKKRLLPVEIDGDAAPGNPIMVGERRAGQLRSVAGNSGIAFLRLEQAEGDLATESGAGVKVRWPGWLPR